MSSFNGIFTHWLCHSYFLLRLGVDLADSDTYCILGIFIASFPLEIMDFEMIKYV